MNDKVYIVLERAYEYNDEGYDSSEGGNVVTAFDSEASAQAEVKRRTVELMVKEPDFVADCLGYEMWGDKVQGFKPLAYVEDHDELEGAIIGLSDEDKVALAEFLSESFFLVQETVLEVA